MASWATGDVFAPIFGGTGRHERSTPITNENEVGRPARRPAGIVFRRVYAMLLGLRTGAQPPAAEHTSAAAQSFFLLRLGGFA